MPAPILSGMVTFLEDKLGDGYEVYDGEIPRFNTDGDPVDLPASLCVVRFTTPREGFGRDDGETFEDPHNDQGLCLLEMWGTTRAQVEGLLDTLEEHLLLQGNWRDIVLGDAYEVSNILVKRWGCYQMEEARTKTGTYVYYGFFNLQIGTNGTVRSR